MSSNNIAIKVENISKCYRIGLKENMHDSIGGAVLDFMKSPLKNYREYRSLYKFDNIDPNSDSDSSTNSSDIIWALRDVSFEVKEGEVVGFIGKNGAGKSTLLKILSKVTSPTSGRAEIRGRVSSLLEVGTGFHPELTGRENIYLNGTVLGMKKKEIDRKFDEIVAFSEVEKFLDTPVKRYSSGMRVRLAFSVAAHLDPEILVIDEVLAVGDLAFQKKCLGKMENMSKGGRTVLFVSHNMGIISELCNRCILLSNGEIIGMGEAKDTISKYISNNSISAGYIELRKWSVDRSVDGPMRILYLSTRDHNGQIQSQFVYGQPITFNIGVCGQSGATCIVRVGIRDSAGYRILHFSNTDDSFELSLPSSESEIHMCLPENVLNDGTYNVTVWLGDGFNLLHDVVRKCLSFTVESAAQGHVKSQSPVRLPARWKTQAIQKVEPNQSQHIRV